MAGACHIMFLRITGNEENMNELKIITCAVCHVARERRDVAGTSCPLLAPHQQVLGSCDT